MAQNRPLLVLKAKIKTTRSEYRNENDPKLTSTYPVSLQNGIRNEMSLN